jgi:DNA-binding beta-propeller fold protein YncE
MALACAIAALLLAAVPAGTAAAPSQSATRDVLFVANNWDGTADLIDPHSFQRVARINIVPDKDARMAEIMVNPVALGYFLAIRQAIGEGHDQFADDMFSSHDGRFLYVSRPSFADVVAFDLHTRQIVWRTKVEGYRADHMAISPDGTRLAVSASTARKVHIIDTATGRIVGSFESGDSPHENNYSPDGKRIYHASIGMVYTPLDQPALDSTKGDRWFEVVDAQSLKVLKRIDVGKKLDEAGYPNMSSAVRPMAVAPGERYFYFQLSFLHGFVEYDLQEDRPLRIATLPQSEEAKQTPREQYLLDSAHHGLAMNPEGTKLCAAGTMSGYAAIVSRATFAYKIIPVGRVPYWATNSADGQFCFVSVAGEDRVEAISYRNESEVARIAVGDHPQRMRMGKVRVADYGGVAGASAAACGAAVTPLSWFDRRASGLSRRRLVLRGRANDGCAANGGARLARVIVSVARVYPHNRCRFVSAHGGLGRMRSCDRPVFRRARGRASWTLTVGRRLPRGRYRAQSKAVDRGGIAEQAVRYRSAPVNAISFRLR